MPERPIEIAPAHVKREIESGEPVTVIDVRRHDEVEAWPFPGSVHVPLGELKGGAMPEVGPGPVVILCAHGNRSREAAELLRRRGVEARSMIGGLAAWSQLYDDVVIPLGPALDVVQFRRLGKGCLSYLVVSGEDAAALDPSWEIEQYLEGAERRGSRLRYVIDTHLHADHVSGARALAEAAGAALCLNPVDPFGFAGYQAVGDGASLPLGRATLTAMAAPGHTAGSLVWDLDGRALATGDVLFLENIGRPDLHGQAEAFARDLFGTLRRLLALPADRLVLPGHMPEQASLTFGQPHADRLGAVAGRLRIERREADFVARVAQVPPRPPNDQVIVEVNRRGTPIAREDAAQLEEGPNRCAVKSA